jgi:hypothetical protein
MDFRSIVTYLSMKELNAREIYTDMNDTKGNPSKIWEEFHFDALELSQ